MKQTEGDNNPKSLTPIVFIDTEVDVDIQKVQDYGAVREDDVFIHTHSSREFNAFISESNTLCGHNIIEHDLKYINLQKNYTFIDTLPLSPLLFPKKPYHKLVKDDKLQVDELNNPVNDSKKPKTCSMMKWRRGKNYRKDARKYIKVCY